MSDGISSGTGDTKECRYCAETIKAAAIKCRYCGSDLTAANAAIAPAPETVHPAVAAEADRQTSYFAEVAPRRAAQPEPPISAAGVAVARPVAHTGDEKVYHQDQTVTVTITRAIIGGKAYALANITSVSSHEEKPNRTFAILLIIVSVIAFFAGASSQEPSAIFRGSAFLIVGGLIAASQKSKFWVRIASASAESNAIWALDPAYIQKVVGAINTAIVGRG
jgi:hypothetical protein